jgi:hypothetical protein
MCHVQGELSPVMVTEHTAPDREHFWQCWRALGGDEQNLIWESGQRFVSPCSAAPCDNPPAAPEHSGLFMRVCMALVRWWDTLWARLFPWDDED